MKTAEELMTTYADMVYRIALSQTRRREDADDVFQEVFLALIRRTEAFDGDEHEKAWIIRATLSLSKKQYANAFERHRTDLNDTTGTHQSGEIPSYYGMESEEAEVYQAVMDLPDRYRSVIHLYYYEGYSVKEIAAMLEMKEGTVKSHMSRARSLLKEAIAS